MARLIPNPIGDITGKVDNTLAEVDVVLGRVDGTLVHVDDKLGLVEGTLVEVSGVLADVRGLLTELRDELDLLQQVPAIAAQVQEIHALVSKPAKGR